MTVLITGAGLVGSHVAALEVAAGRRPVLFDIAASPDALSGVVDPAQVDLVRGDVRSAWDLARTIKAHGVTRVIHTAANPGLTPGAQRDPLLAVEINLMGSMNVLEAARALDLERVVLCSTSSLFQSMSGGQDHGRIGAEEAFERPNTVYATTKQAMENIALNYHDIFGVDVISLRLAGVYGAFAGGGGMGTDMLRTMLRSALAGRPVEIPRLEIDWIHARDAADALHRACWVPAVSSRVINASTGVLTTAEDLAEIVRELVPGVAVTVSDGPTRPGRVAEIERARTELGFTATCDMRTGLGEFLSYLREHPAS